MPKKIQQSSVLGNSLQTWPLFDSWTIPLVLLLSSSSLHFISAVDPILDRNLKQLKFKRTITALSPVFAAFNLSTSISGFPAIFNS
jgi:hypothetical protein